MSVWKSEMQPLSNEAAASKENKPMNKEEAKKKLQEILQMIIKIYIERVLMKRVDY